MFTVIALVPYYWGKGKTLGEALSNIPSHARGKLREVLFYVVSGDDEAWVDDMGCICYKQGSTCIHIKTLQIPKKAKKKRPITGAYQPDPKKDKVSA